MGVERIFASPGSDWAPLWEALARPHAPGEIPEYVSVRHEETAVAMASGYARATGKLPAVVLHTTVGTLHAAMALRIALHERVPMVVMAGESTTFSEPPAPESRAPVAAPADRRRWTCAPRRAERQVELRPQRGRAPAADRAARLPARDERAARAGVRLGADRVPDGDAGESAACARRAPAAAAAATPRRSTQIAEALSAAQRPLIVTEEAGRDPAAVRALVGARGEARRAGGRGLAAVLPQLSAQPSAVRGRACRRTRRSSTTADVVLLAECVLPWHPPSALKPAKRVRARARTRCARNFPTGASRPTSSFRATCARASKRSPRASTSRARAGTFRSARRWRAASEGMTNSLIATRLNAALPKDAIVVNETITHRLELLQRLTRLEPGGFYEASFGGLGMGLSACARREARRAPPAGDRDHRRRRLPLQPGGGLLRRGAGARAADPGAVFDNAGYLSQKTDVATYYPRWRGGEDAAGSQARASRRGPSMRSSPRPTAATGRR